MLKEGPPQPIEVRGPFKVIHREILYDRFGRQFIADKVIRPDGTEGEQVWDNFTRPAVLVFPIDEEGNIYLTEEFTYGTNEYPTEVAGGSVDEGETLEDAAKREVKEELGIEVEELLNLGPLPLREMTSRSNNRTQLFLAKVKSVGEAKPETGEVIRLKKVPFEEAFQMVMDGEITTATVAYGILKIRLLTETQE